jgi:REP element-mobilizing transposase RayT
MGKIPLEPEKYYHLFNHANGMENLFLSSDNYDFFISKYIYHISPIAKTYAYCLMPNHFHFAIQIKPKEQLENYINKKFINNNAKKWQSNIEGFISKQFSNLFSSYTQAFNKQQNRMGSLFIPNFSRKEISSDEYLRQLIRYIHYNPVHHGFKSDIREWNYSSYNSIILELDSCINQTELLEFFNSLEDFIEFHCDWSNYQTQKSSLDL